MVVDGEKFEVEIPRETRHTQRQQATLKVNGQVKHVVSMVVDGEKFEVEIPRETRHTQRQQATFKVNGQVKQVQQQQQQQREEIKETHVTRHEDGVYSIHSYKYGVEVIADGERLM